MEVSEKMRALTLAPEGKVFTILHGTMQLAQFDLPQAGQEVAAFIILTPFTIMISHFRTSL